LKAVSLRRAQGELDHKQVLMDRGLEFYREVIMVYNTLQGFVKKDLEGGFV
jgi:hypothetical protein